MEISETGCAAYATTIPILLLAGFFAERHIMAAATSPLWFRIFWLAYTGFALFGTFLALRGAATGGLQGLAGRVLDWSAMIAAAGLFIEVLVSLFLRGKYPYEDRRQRER